MARRFFKGPHLIYLAGPMANVTQAEAQGWRAEMHQELHKVGMFGFDPSQAWGWAPRGLVTPEMVPIIQTIDDVAVAMSSALVVRYQGVESVGTDHEIRLANALDKPIVLWVDLDMVEEQHLVLNEWEQRMFPGGDRVWRGYNAATCANKLARMLS